MEITVLNTEFKTSDLTICIAIFAVTLFIVKLFIKKLDDINSAPPGPWGFPVVGHLPLLGKNPAKTLMKISKQYGDVFKIRMGSWPTIVLNSTDAIREALIDNSEVFSDRPEFYTAQAFNNMKSLAFGSYTSRWRLHKKIANNVLRRYASTKNNSTEEIINREAENVTKSFLQTNGKPFDPNDQIFMSVGCVIFQLCFGDANNCRENDKFLKFVSDTKSFVELAGAGNPIDVLPWLRYLMPWKTKKFDENIKMNRKVVQDEIKCHLETYDTNINRDITDGLIGASEQYGNSAELFNGITKREIMSSLEDFMGAGFETVSTTLQWIILYLAFYRNVQKRVHEEIQCVLGNRKPILNDTGKLPYTEATILEVIRLANVVPMGLPHSTTADIKFRDFKIKKGSVIFPNNYATARDPKIWENPFEFRPQRFLNKDNEIIQGKLESILTFGLGRRRCPGESLAKLELLLFVTCIFQRCDIVLCTDANFEGVFGLTCKPEPYEIKITERL